MFWHGDRRSKTGRLDPTISALLPRYQKKTSPGVDPIPRPAFLVGLRTNTDARGSSWWRNLVMDDDKTAPPQPEIVISPEFRGNGLDERNRNMSSASVGDR
ncbi:unnamed protein product [Caenorhabditis auriculariae]|uniref:Uncharacterized protein n=1 Tax=Caenorhabditis auriculariae TaxID=2777116 RepID=A0A8S1HPH8_9PELO|nr:unnamed protein product [Caenorhabditis auriculariae]